MKKYKIPLRYIPNKLSKKDKLQQKYQLIYSKKQYKEKNYITRKKIKSYKHKTSNHITNAKKIYKIDNLLPNKDLVVKTGCSLSALRNIMKKGEGAYYSSGSSPNQTAQSWGLARLASSITAGKSAAVDFNIIAKGCKHSKKAYILAKQARKKYYYGRSKTKKIYI